MLVILCHVLFFRFLFTYVPMSDGARIDVTVSELYDSTYVGNPHDLVRLKPDTVGVQNTYAIRNQNILMA